MSAEIVAAFGEPGLLAGTDRGVAVAAMAAAFAKFIVTRDDIAGIVGIGGGGGTSIATAGMRALPIGIPKLMVSTLASGDTAPYVDVSDIVMMPAITDLAGLNRISRVVLTHAAEAIAAMSVTPPQLGGDRPAVGLTMFGVTTTAVTQIVDRLGGAVEAIVFHATGTGGRAMETLVDSGLLTGVIDITTTEIADLLFGGVLPAAPGRLDCIARTKIPYVGSVGACDMINFWAREYRAGEIRRPAVLPAQRQRHADADQRRGVSRHRHLDRQQAERLRRFDPFPHSRKGCLCSRHRGRPIPRRHSRRCIVRRH